MTTDSLLTQWQAAILATEGSIPLLLKEDRARQRCEQKLNVWLGHPRKGSPIYEIGEALERLLGSQGCEVALSAGHAAEIEPEELGRVFDLLFLVVASPGTCAEAMELVHSRTANPKLNVFLPEEYKDGYLAKSLGHRHRILSPLNFFSLQKAEVGGEQLACKMLATINRHRNFLLQKHATQSSFPVQSITQNIFNNNIGSLMGDNITATNSTIINKSTVQNAFNAVNQRYGPTTAQALVEVSDHIAKSGNKEAIELMNGFNEELEKAEPKKNVLRSLWERILILVPSVSELTAAGAAAAGIEIAKLFVSH